MRCKLCKTLTFKRLSKNHHRKRDFEDMEDLEKYTYHHHISWASLEHSARNGCELCQLFRRSLHKKYPNLPEKIRRRLDEANTTSEIDSEDMDSADGSDRIFIGLDHSKSVSLGTKSLWINQLRIFLGYSNGMRLAYHVGIDLFISRFDPYAAKTFILGRDIDPQPLSTRNIELVENWILNCKAKHPICAPGHAERPLPTRVIYIGSGSQSMPNHARILETQGRSGYYASLSYCWGDGPDGHKTTKRNIRSRKNCLVLEDLPQTLKDAILVTTKLGLQYLWIDSICIIQDSPSDKRKELTRMKDVYRNAFITIAAGNARCSQDGFLQYRERSTFRLDWDERGSSDREPQVFCGPSVETWPDCAREGVLSTRGWTFQERLLSPRTLYFGKDQIHWECDTCIFSENQILAVRDHVSVSTRKEDMYEYEYTVKHDMRDWRNYIKQVAAIPQFSARLFHKILHRDTTSPNFESLEQIESLGGFGGINDSTFSPESTILFFKKWTVIVNEYSRRTLSNSHDKLDALSAIAQQLAEANSSEYVAGIWTPDIFELRGLLWVQKSVASAVRDKESGEIQERHYCPSWSWASVGGEIGYYNWSNWGSDSWQNLGRELINKARVEDLSFRLSSEEHPYGDVLKGVVKLRGQWGYLPHKIASNDFPTELFSPVHNKPTIEITIDTMIKERHGMEYLSCQSTQNIIRSRSQHLSPILINEHSIKHLHRRPYCIRIADVKKTDHLGKYVIESWFLVLERVKNEEGTFRRIGIGHYTDFWAYVPLHEWGSIWKSEGRTIRLI